MIVSDTAELPAEDFAYLCRLMHERAAIVLEPGKEEELRKVLLRKGG